MNILLLGLMGSGKSTIGKALAKEMELDFLELDPLILDNTGLSDVEEVYRTRMSLWTESQLEVMKKLSYKDNQVIATSSSIVENDLGLQYFRENSKVNHIIYLSCSPKVLTNRLLFSEDKATSINRDKIIENLEVLFKKRDVLYRMYSSDIIETDEKSLSSVLKEIMEKIEK